MRGSRDRGLDPPPPLKNHKYIGFLSNIGPDPPKNHKATKPAINVGKLLARQRNPILMAFRWLAIVCPLVFVFESSDQLQKVGPSPAKFFGSPNGDYDQEVSQSTPGTPKNLLKLLKLF